MTTWILAVLALWFAQVFFAAGFRTVLSDDPSTAIADHMRGKDDAPEPNKLGGRAARAQDNLAESLPIFLALALLHEIHGTQDGLAGQGAALFFFARVAYVPAYLSAIPGLRTVMWAAATAGLGMMAWAAL